jgi:excisionase family DNA binding protein
MDQDQLFLRPAHLAPQLGVSTSRIYQLIAARAVPAVRIDGAVRIPKDAWEHWLRDQCDRALKSVRQEETAESSDSRR